MATGKAIVDPTIVTSGNWRIVKWQDGRVDLYYLDANYSFTATTQRGSLFYYDTSFTFPFNVFDAVVIGSIGGNTSTAAPFLANLRAYQASTSFSVASSINSVVSGCKLSIIVHGRWK